MPEGINNLYGDTYDATGKTTRYQAGTIKIDRTAPELSLTGRLHELRSKELYANIYPLSVNASDGSTSSSASQRSGVKRIKIYFDDVLVRRVDQAQPGDSAGLSADWTLDLNSAEVAPGPHSELQPTLAVCQGSYVTPGLSY